MTEKIIGFSDRESAVKYADNFAKKNNCISTRHMGVYQLFNPNGREEVTVFSYFDGTYRIICRK